MKGQVLTTICVGLLSATMAYADSSENMGASDNMNGTSITNSPAGTNAGTMNDMPSMPSNEPPSSNPDANPEGGSADTATGDDNDY